MRQPATAAAAVGSAPGSVAVGAGPGDRLRPGGGRVRSFAAKVVWAISIGLAVASPWSRCAGAAAQPPIAPEPRQPVTTRTSPARLCPGCAGDPGPVTPSTATIVRPGPGTALGRYLLVDQIGAGGMAEVYTAVSFGVGEISSAVRHQAAARRADGNATAVSLFIDEANLASTLVHPNVVPVFDFGEAAGFVLPRRGVHRRPRSRAASRARLRDRGDPLLSRNTILYLANEILDRARVRARQARRRRAAAGARPP